MASIMSLTRTAMPSLALRAPAAVRASRAANMVVRAEAPAKTRVFTDEEWEKAVEIASEALVQMRANAPAEASTDGSAAAAPAPEGRVFSDAEWATAIEEASKMVAAAKAIESALVAEGVTATDGTTATPKTFAPAPVGRIFSDEEWDAALTTAVAELQKGSSEAGAESVSMVTPEGRVFSDAEWTDAIERANLLQCGELVEGELVPVSFGDAMAISGPVPEVVNGRVAMIGFVAAVAAEMASGNTVASQFGSATPGVLIFAAAFSAASLIPTLAGKPAEAVGPFTPQAEALNGRAAMIGLAALFLIEGATGSALF